MTMHGMQKVIAAFALSGECTQMIKFLLALNDCSSFGL